MKRTLLAILSALLLAPPSWGQADAEPVFKVSSQAEFDACTAVTYNYVRDPAWAWANNSIRLWYYVPGGGKHYVDDYLISPELELEANCLYSMEIKALSYSGGTTNAGSMQLLIADADAELPGGFGVLLTQEKLPYQSTFRDVEPYKVEFTVPATGKYKVALRGYGELMKANDWILTSLGESPVPRAVADLNVTPGAAGALNATVSFTMPSETITGQPLTGDLTYVLSRDDDVISTATAAPGATVSYTDDPAPEGPQTYSVVVKSGDDASDAATVSTYIGYETPAAPANAAFTTDGDTHVVTWEVPAGIHGVVLDPSTLAYSVSRVVNGAETLLGSVTGATTYTDTYAVTAPTRLSYRITAANGDKTSEAAETAAAKLGHINLPFADSFAGADFGSNWDVEQVSGTTGWTAEEDGYIGRATSDEISPVDNDGGMAYFPGFNANKSNQSRLVTAPVSRSSSTSPAVEFYLFKYTGTNKTDEGVKIQVSADNGEWTDVEGGHVTVKGDATGWQKYDIVLGDAIPADCSTYRIGFMTVNEYGYNIALDAVRVFNAIDNDLSVAVSAPATIVAGKEITLTVTVANNGTSDVAADAYTLAFLGDLAHGMEIPEMQPLPALSAVSYTFSLALDAEQARVAETVAMTATVEYAGDADIANNAATAAMATAFADKAPVEGLTLGRNEEGARTLSWTAAGDPAYVPLSFTEDFEDLEEGTTGQFNHFRGIDLDGKAGDTWYLVSGSDLNVVAPFSTVEKHGSKIVGVSVPSWTQQDDWLISEKLSCADISTYDMSLYIGFRGDRSSYTHKFEVLYTTAEEYDAADPAASFTNVIKQETTSSYGSDPIRVDNKLYKRSYTGIPAEARYIAIHLNTNANYSTAMWLDDITITENNPEPLLGYNVYQQGVGRLNSELIPSSELQFALGELTFPADGTVPEYYVTAVYPAGETAPSASVTIIVPKAPAELTASLSHDIFTGRNDITATWQAPDDALVVRTYIVRLNGAEVARTEETAYTFESVASGENVIAVATYADDIESTETTASLTVSDSDYARLTFTVGSNNGFVPEGLEITVGGYGETPLLLAVADNKAEIGYLPLGSYTASLAAERYKGWSAEISLSADSDVSVGLEEIIVTPVDLRVDITEPAGGEPEYLLSWNHSDIEMYRVTGYTVTLDGEQNATGLTETSCRLTGVTEGSHTAGVRADYASGSSEETTVMFNGMSGIAGGGIQAIAVRGLRGMIRVSGLSGDSLLEVFNAAGTAVYAGRADASTVEIPAAAGVYVVKTACGTAKVIVK